MKNITRFLLVTASAVLITVNINTFVGKVIHAIKKADPNAFVNILQTKVLKGNFFMKKNN